MKFRSILLSLTILAATSGLRALDRSNSYVGETSLFNIANKTDAPGKTLLPGKYFILVVDQYSDRMIVRVENEATKDHVIFLAVPQPGLDMATARGPVGWSKGPDNSPALRGYAFSPGMKVEFVYPKSEAVEIATRNAARVIAVDPESEGMPQLTSMSKDDMRMVNLWALSLSTVGPSGKAPAIQAKKYESDQPALASNEPTAPAQKHHAASQDVATLEKPQLGAQSANPTASTPAKRKPIIAKLPHTASPVASVAFLGIFFLMASLLFRLGSKLTIIGSNNG
jgi:hypothetical protein